MLTGGALMVYGLSRRGLVGLLCTAGGAGMIASTAAKNRWTRSRCMHRCGRYGSARSFNRCLDGPSSAKNDVETDRWHALRQAIKACRKGGTISMPGVPRTGAPTCGDNHDHTHN